MKEKIVCQINRIVICQIQRVTQLQQARAHLVCINRNKLIRSLNSRKIQLESLKSQVQLLKKIKIRINKNLKVILRLKNRVSKNTIKQKVLLLSMLSKEIKVEVAQIVNIQSLKQNPQLQKIKNKKKVKKEQVLDQMQMDLKNERIYSMLHLTLA